MFTVFHTFRTRRTQTNPCAEYALRTFALRAMNRIPRTFGPSWISHAAPSGFRNLAQGVVETPKKQEEELSGWGAVAFVTKSLPGFLI